MKENKQKYERILRDEFGQWWLDYPNVKFEGDINDYPIEGQYLLGTLFQERVDIRSRVI